MASFADRATARRRGIANLAACCLVVYQHAINFKPTTSVGFTSLADVASTFDALLQVADGVLRRVKADAKHGIQLAGIVWQTLTINMERQS